MTHPAWLAVGQPVEQIRRLGRSVAWRKTATVVRQTKTLVVLDNGTKFKLTWGGNYAEAPKYLDYITVIRPAPEASVESWREFARADRNGPLDPDNDDLARLHEFYGVKP